MNETLRTALTLLVMAGVLRVAGEAPAADQQPRLLQAATILTGTNQTTLKGLALQLGDKAEASVCFDTELLRWSAGWTGGFITPIKLMSRGEYPKSEGKVKFESGPRPGWAKPEFLSDPRGEPFGPLPEDWARFQGVYRFGMRAVVASTVGGTEVLELPWYDSLDGIFTRSFNVGACPHPLMLLICRIPPEQVGPEKFVEKVGKGDHGYVVLNGSTNSMTAVGVLDAPREADFEVHDRHLYLRIPAHDEEVKFQLQIWTGEGEQPRDRFIENFHRHSPFLDPRIFTRGGEPLWKEPVVTRGVSGREEGAHAVDTLTVPYRNPYGSEMYLAGLDFFSDGRAAVCTFHGDVWVVEGIDEGLGELRWRRFAAGLYHALGLKIEDDRVYVTGRDQITRLHDLNEDGEADFYENFNNRCLITTNFHEFAMDLQTDPEGNFYFAKAGPVQNGGRGFQQILPHHGCLFKISPEGQWMGVVATGFRAPNGIGVGPDGQLTSGDNEGTWMPRCRLNWIEPGSFQGVVDLAHREEPPETYDPPLCWLPKAVDNSSGGQVWVPDDRWGPYAGRLLHLSYGTSSLFSVLKEEIDGVVQGGVTRFPLRFQSGIMRARFNPGDGQLYVVGMKGWQTSGVLTGCLQRVRYTGEEPVRMPHELHVFKHGIQIVFTDPLDRELAGEPENYAVSQWNYIWSSAYGSPEVSVAKGEAPKPAAEGDEWTQEQKQVQARDTLEIREAIVSPDGRAVLLMIDGLRPVMQMEIRFNLETEDGVPLRHSIHNTIHRLKSPF